MPPRSSPNTRIGDPAFCTRVVHAVLLGAFFAAAPSCVESATEVVVVIDTNVPPQRLLTLTATVMRAATDGGNDHVWVRGTGVPGAITTPASFAIVPAAGESSGDTVTLLVEGTSPATATGDPQIDIRRIARFAFTPHTETYVQIFLNVACLDPGTGCLHATGTACTVQQACEDHGGTCGNDATCVTVVVDTTTMGVDVPVSIDAVNDLGTGDVTERADVPNADAPEVVADVPIACGAVGEVCCSGAMCGASAVCAGGSCIACGANGEVCCTSGPACAGGVTCTAGTCGACTAGTPCASTNPCHTASIDCSSGSPVCNDTGNVTTGTACTGGVCSPTGACVACTQGMACTSVNACHDAAIDCSGGGPACVDDALMAAGTSCGTDLVCDPVGNCVACTEGMACTSSDPCRSAAIECSGGGAVCMETSELPAGTSCGTSEVCLMSGACVPCGATGQPCCAASACNSGLGCASGSCVACGAVGQACCPGGTCMSGELCVAGSCVACAGPGLMCATEPCCAGTCMASLCVTPCTPSGGVCEMGSDCCSGMCDSFTEVCF